MRDFMALEMEPTGCPESSAQNYHYSLRNNPEERSSVSNMPGQTFRTASY
jgi:hypothetical protein